MVDNNYAETSKKTINQGSRVDINFVQFLQRSPHKGESFFPSTHSGLMDLRNRSLGFDRYVFLKSQSDYIRAVGSEFSAQSLKPIVIIGFHS